MAPTHKVEIPALPGLVSGQNPAKPSNEQLQDESILYQTCIAISPMQAGYAADDHKTAQISEILKGLALTK